MFLNNLGDTNSVFVAKGAQRFYFYLTLQMYILMKLTPQFLQADPP